MRRLRCCRSRYACLLCFALMILAGAPGALGGLAVASSEAAHCQDGLALIQCREAESSRSRPSRACASVLEHSGCWGTFLTDLFYRAAHAAGESVVESQWEHIHDCAQLNLLESEVHRTISILVPKRPHHAAHCLIGGLFDGASEKLDRVRTQCRVSCERAGSFAGSVSAATYCSLSQLSGGLVDPSNYVKEPESRCGIVFEQACKESFRVTVAQFKNSAGTCESFVTGRFTESVERYRQKFCGYPEPVAPRPQSEVDLRRTLIRWLFSRYSLFKSRGSSLDASIPAGSTSREGTINKAL